jgi:hypothetical protein
MPTWAVSIPKLPAISDSRPTGANSVVLKIKAAIASVTTRSHATLRETVFVIIGFELVLRGRREGDLKTIAAENTIIL